MVKTDRFCVQVLSEFARERSVFANLLSPLDMQLVDEISEYLSVKGVHDWSIGLSHVKALCMLSTATLHITLLRCYVCHIRPHSHSGPHSVIARGLAIRLTFH